MAAARPSAPPLASPGRPRARAVHASHPAAAAPPRRVALAPGRGRKATIELLRTQGHKGVKWKRGVQGRAWAVQGGGKVRDPCMGRAGWLGRAQGWVGGSFGAPRFDHGLLAPSSQTKKRKVTSTPEVPGPSRSWNPAPAAPSSPLDFLNCSFERESRELERVVPQSLEREPRSFLSVRRCSA